MPTTAALENTTTVLGNATTRCSSCGNQLPNGSIECPVCGQVNLERSRKRADYNRPTREEVETVDSRNGNGSYKIYKNSDGSHSCDCLSFLHGGSFIVNGYAACKHIRRSVPDGELVIARPASDWQAAALKKLGANPVNMTNAQAYFAIGAMLKKQGIEYREFESLLRTAPKVEFLPTYSFGMEFEGGCSNSNGGFNAFVRALAEVVEIRSEAYNHDVKPHWKIVGDGSVHVDREYYPLELVSPKLFAAEGIAQTKAALTAWNKFGSTSNKSCGLHVHVDAYGWKRMDLIRLLQVWMKIESPVLWKMVAPSRRNNQYCKAVTTYMIRQVAQQGVRLSDRYYSVNPSAFQRHGTIEFRLHGGTTMPEKAIPWAVFCLMLMGAVKRGLTHDQVEPTLDGVLSAIGMEGATTPLIKKAARILRERHEEFSQKGDFPNLNPEMLRIEEVDEMVRRSAIESAQSNYCACTGRNTVYLQRLIEASRVLPAIPEGTEAGHIRQVAIASPSQRIPAFETVQAAEGETTENGTVRNFTLPSLTTPDRTHQITYNTQTGMMSCDCQGYRRLRRCYHTIAVARYIALTAGMVATPFDVEL